MYLIIHLFVLSLLFPLTVFAVTPTPSPSPTPAPLVGCSELTVVSGNNELVPSAIRFKATSTNENVDGYRFFFGDGRQQESDTGEILHRYDVSGTFTVRAEVKNNQGVYNTIDSCETTVTVKPLPLIESHRSACSNVFIIDGNTDNAPATGVFKVTGYDNKGSIKNYRIEFGDGTVLEQPSGVFEKRYDSPGTYAVSGYILDSQDQWVGGTSKCKTNFIVNTDKMTVQPKTGTPTIVSIIGVSSGIVSFVLWELRKRYSSRRGR